MTIGYDAKRIVSDNTGLGCYGRTLVNDIAEAVQPGTTLNLYAPGRGNDDLRRQVLPRQNVRYVYPDKALDGLPREKMHCSVMGQEALEAAIRNWKGEPAMPHAQEEGKLVCKCFNVTDQTIIKAIRENNLTTLEDITAFTKAGGACGTCLDEISEILEEELRRQGKGEAAAGVAQTIAQNEKVAASHTEKAAPAGLTNIERMQKVMAAMQLIRPQLQADGGDVRLVDISGKVVSVELTGHCGGCPASQATLHQVIESILRMQVEPDIVVKEVKA